MPDDPALQSERETEAPALRSAVPADRGAIAVLLSSYGLPVDDLDAVLEGFVVADARGEIVGCGCIEAAPPAALLRSLAVSRQWQVTGLAERLLHALERRALARGCDTLYLLTTTAARWFEWHGFERIAREAFAPTLRDTAQFRSLCPVSAVVMRRACAARPG
jgi:amino-acid N-acetyltransferase